MKEVDLRMLAERGVGLNASALTVPCIRSATGNKQGFGGSEVAAGW